MKKFITIAALAFAGIALAPPAQADNDTNFSDAINAATNWNFTAAAVCFQELAVVPVGAAWTGGTVNNCVNGNVLNHSS